MYTELNDLILNMENEIIEAIQESIRIPSVKGPQSVDAPYGEQPKAALEHALTLGKNMGFTCGNVGNRVGWIEFGQGEEMVGVLGHLDVVPAGEGWTYPAFGGEIHNGRLFGRGVMDDKGASIGAIFALKAVRDSGIPLKRRIRVIFGTDEESGCSCVRHYVSTGEEIPDLGFTPDGDYPLIFCEKGMTTITAGKRNVEQGEIKVLEFDGGTAKNIVTEKCRAIIEGIHNIPEQEGVRISIKDGNTVIEAEGKGAHGANPQLGVNAAVRLLQAVQHVKFTGPFQQMREFILQKIGTKTNGKSLGIHYQDEETGETTVNLGMLSYQEDTLSFTLDIRYPKNGEPERVYSLVEEALREYGLEILECTSEKVLYKEKTSELIQKLMKVYKEVTGRDEEPLAIGGGTYAKMFPNMVAFGPNFPGNPDVIHKPDESATIEDIIRSVQITANAMAELAQ